MLRLLLRIALWLCLSVATAVVLLVLLWKAADFDYYQEANGDMPETVALEEAMVDSLAQESGDDPVYLSLFGRIFPNDMLGVIHARRPEVNLLSCPPTSKWDRTCAVGYRNASDDGGGHLALIDVTRVEIPLWHLAQIRYSFYNGGGERILIKVFGKWRIIDRWDVHVLVTKILDEDDDESPAEDEAPKQLKVPRGGP
ncbi:hypothetical protein [Nitrospirillum bahiense]|uniref:Uncharacterized protein n=1 Tax=Nitrospirillum amazonense TaxID=28077 RepID=A0A560G546_9PROT|nr:hypothetical protein [Nitrospirillum amazonense]TWB28870.1 hypothetical protein FBZ88_10435 [Nitrospirillum amazonense]